MELNREQIITELEGLVKFRTCPEYVQKAFALINELTEENERLHASCTELTQKCASLNEENERLMSIIVEAQKRLDNISDINCEILTHAKNVRADTVRKMQERFIAELRKDGRMNYYIRKVLDQIAKEMLEGEK